MQSVLISIRPQWCAKIASGKKTIEVRKSRPKLETPFKCYIYCTQGEEKWLVGIIGKHPSEKLNGKVIGDFMCDQIKKHSYDDFIGAVNADGSERTEAIQGEGTYWFWENERKKTCLSQDEIFKYGGTKPLYAWHISALQIYDKPRELSEFYHYLPDKILYNGDYDCRGGGEIVCMDMPEGGSDCEECPYGGRVYLKRPPQSWAYIEELEEPCKTKN